MNARILQGPEAKYPVHEKSLGHFFFNRCIKYSEKICQIDGTADKTETYASVKLRSIRVAIELQKRGITSNDVIVLCIANTLNDVVAIIASQYLGAKVANLHSSLSIRHITYLLNLVTPKIIFVEEASVGLIEQSLIEEKFDTEIVVFGSSEKYDVFSDFVKLQENEEEFAPLEVDPDDGALMFFSSGTTGMPKAVCHSHRSYLEITSQACQCGYSDSVLHFTSFYWMTAMMILMGTFNFGSYRVFCRNPSAEDIFRIIEKYKVKCMFMAPVLTYKLTRFDRAQNYDTSSLKILTYGGTPIADSQIKNIMSLFPKAKTSQLYGMTEIGFIAGFYTELDQEQMKSKIGSSGTAGPNIRLKIVDQQTGEKLGPNQKGEICVTSPSLMKGYYKMESSKVFDDDGFLKTGDVGYYDEDKFLYVIERIKEMFKYQSWHIIPSAIEAVLLEHPAVKEAVVFGVTHIEDGEVPAACVVLKEGCALGEREIDTFLQERVADRERLRGGVTFVENLPRTPTGKVVRGQVKDFVVNMKKESDQ